ncbi:MAG: MOSC domain-containing protein [Sulfurovum sp.]|nr:MAG: MOSC domain-containing protein [Sulfurovum sp.]
MKSSIGTIITLFISKEGMLSRKETKILTLDEKGIIEDKYYNKSIQRSVLITSRESYILAKKTNIDMSYGSLGENLLIDYNPYHLSMGQKLQVGNVILEISQNCTLCDHLSNIDKKLPTLLKNDRGIFAKVLQGGIIKEGDKIYLKNPL